MNGGMMKMLLQHLLDHNQPKLLKRKSVNLKYEQRCSKVKDNLNSTSMSINHQWAEDKTNRTNYIKSNSLDNFKNGVLSRSKKVL